MVDRQVNPPHARAILVDAAKSTTDRPADMTSPRVLLWACLVVVASAGATDWQPKGESDRQDITTDLLYAERSAARPSDGRQVTAHLAFFTSAAFRLKVVDLGAGAEPVYPTLADAFRAKGCVAGVNGGFFHPDLRPAGLVIAEGRRINRFETAKLLSGVVPSSGITRTSPRCCRAVPISWRARGRCGVFPRPIPTAGPSLPRMGTGAGSWVPP